MFYVTDSMRNGKVYNGNTQKFGITYGNKAYIVKFSKGNDLSVLSEYIASNVIKRCGVSCHNVYLASYNNHIVNLIEDFTYGYGIELHSYKDTKQSSEDTDLSTKDYTYDDVLYLIDKHLKLSDSQKIEAKHVFWRMFICDAIMGNRDRHWGNWGYLVRNGVFLGTAPLYDNGAGLFPGVLSVLNEYTNNATRKKFLYDRVYIFPASLFKIKKPDRNYRSNYYEMFGDLRINKIFAEEVKSFKNRVSWKVLFKIVADIILPLTIDNYLKRFYIEIIVLRYRCIILRENYDKVYKELEMLL